MTTRSGLEETWLASIAFAMVHLKRIDDEESAQHLSARFYEVIDTGGFFFGATMADLLQEIAKLVQRSMPVAAYVLEFHEMGGGPVEPELFETTEEGSASVFTARVLTAASSGDLAMVEDLIESRRLVGDLAISWPLDTMIRAAAQVITEQYPRLAGVDHVLAGGGQPVMYGYRCEGITWQGASETGGECLGADVIDREQRDRAAAFHIANWGHTVRLTEDS